MAEATANGPDATATRLTRQVAALWPELHARLGERAGAFVDTVSDAAAVHALGASAEQARFVNLCCALGPNFEHRPDNEWALAILADERLGPWVKLHQLVVQGAAMLERRGAGGHASGADLLRTDRLVLDALDAAQRSENSEAVPLPRQACDLETVDIRLLEVDWRREYRLVDGAWQLQPLGAPAPALRIAAGQPAPPLVCVLTHGPGRGPAARLQVRLLLHAVCDQDHHPGVAFAGDHGLWSWHGHAALAVSWQVRCATAPVPRNGLGVSLVEESLPQTSLLRLGGCGLRDQGVAAGPLETYVWAYPAHQWLAAWRRQPGVPSQWPAATAQTVADAAPPTVCRIERDGVAMPSEAWARAFHATLDQALAEGWARLLAAWQARAGAASMAVTGSLLAGQASLTWGWREGTSGIGGLPVLRVAGEIDLHNTVALSLAGEIELGSTRTRVRLLVDGHAALQHRFERAHAEPPLFDVLLPLTAQWRFGFRIEWDPVAVDEGALWLEAGACTGALVGAVGLRPGTGNDQRGWQWFAHLAVEAVTAPVCVHDPLLGQSRSSVDLLPAVDLLDWTLG